MVLLLSMHRSGSSLLASLMSSMGLYVGDEVDMIGKRGDNPDGFFERRDVLDINRAILHSSGNGRMNNLPVTACETLPEALDEQLGRLIDELHREGVNLVKEPSLSLTCSAWIRKIQDPDIIILFRHPSEVAESLRTRQNIPLRVGCALWEYYYRLILRSIDISKANIVNFSDLKADPVAECGRINEWLSDKGRYSLNLDPSAIEQIYKPGHVHHVADGGREGITQSQWSLYDAFVRNDHAELAEIAGTVSETCDLVIELWDCMCESGFDERSGKFSEAELRGQVKQQIEKRKALESEFEWLSWAVGKYIDSAAFGYACKAETAIAKMKRKDVEDLASYKMVKAYNYISNDKKKTAH